MVRVALQTGGRSNVDLANDRGPLSLLALPVLVALYAATGALSPGFDDETYTIGWVTGSDTLAGLVATIAGSDVHPPGSYLIVALLHELTGSFPAVRAIAGALNALMLWLLWRATAPRDGLAAAFAFLVLCLSPGLLLWGATLRWYSWFLPLVAALLLLLDRNPPGRWHFWGAGALAATGLFYIGYFALVVLPAFMAAALWRRRGRLASDLPAIAVTTGVLLAAIAPQVLLVLPGQLGGGLQQHDFSLLRTALGAGLQVFLTHGAMPPSLPAAAFAAGNLILVASALRRGRAAFADPWAIVFLGGLATALVSGLAGHFRNLVVLAPAQGLWQARLFGGLSARAWRAAAFGLFLVGTTIGIANVVGHADTTKGSWNTPYPEMLEVISEFRRDCPGAVVVTHDPVLFRHLERRGIRAAWAEDRPPPTEPDMHEPFQRALTAIAEADCLIAVETFRGSIRPDVHRRFREALAARPGPRVVERLRKDRHAWFKRRFDPDVPDHLAVVSFFPPGD